MVSLNHLILEYFRQLTLQKLSEKVFIIHKIFFVTPIQLGHLSCLFGATKKGVKTKSLNALSIYRYFNNILHVDCIVEAMCLRLLIRNSTYFNLPYKFELKEPWSVLHYYRTSTCILSILSKTRYNCFHLNNFVKPFF